MMNLQTAALIVYCLLFVWAARAGSQAYRIVTAFAAYALLAGAGGLLLPGILGFTHRQNMFLLPACMMLGAALPLPPRHRDSGSVYLRLMAESGLAMLSAWLLLLVLVVYKYPAGLSVFALSSLLQLVLWQPLFWIIGQWILMLLMHWGGQTDRKAVFLIALLWFVVYVAADLFGVV